MDLIERTHTFRERHPWEQSKQFLIRSLLKKIPSSFQVRTLLDFGCGDGYILSQIHPLYPNTTVHGYDCNLTEDQRYQLEACHAPIRFHTILERDVQTDLLLLLDVMEHQENDLDFLAQLTRHHLNPHGWILITVPALPMLFSNHDLFLKHHRRYTRKSLLEVVSRSGLEVKASGYAFTSLIVPRFLQRTLERFTHATQAQHGVGHWSHGHLVTRLITNLLSAENALLVGLSAHSIHLPGLTAWTLCQKPSW
ncbi:MAG: methyltransferase domain-containing protein [Magnetococcales bacterium]|nr:methyltransferase domain-containing protein [Magnetococcales bacterium]